MDGDDRLGAALRRLLVGPEEGRRRRPGGADIGLAPQGVDDPGGVSPFALGPLLAVDDDVKRDDADPVLAAEVLRQRGGGVRHEGDVHEAERIESGPSRGAPSALT